MTHHCCCESERGHHHGHEHQEHCGHGHHHEHHRDHDHGHGCCCEEHGHDGAHDGAHDGEHGGEHGGGETGGGSTFGRPGRTTGSSRGRLPTDGGMTKGDLSGDQPGDSWAGQRKDLFLPFLFMRANAGDTGTRPVVGPFWESPDIFVLSSVQPSAAPAVPKQLGQTAQAGAPNTLYAHVWNFGQSAAPQTVVEFYWCDPSLGIGPQSSHLIGETVVSLGARGSGRAHAVVKCPEAWTPTFVNGGHECLVVRAWDYTSDALGTPAWDASLNRHVGQRNIHVVGPAGMTMLAGGPAATATVATPLLLRVGPLYGSPAEVAVQRIAPPTMPWLQLSTGIRGVFPIQAVPTGAPQLSRPMSSGGGIPTGGAAAAHQVTGDDQLVAFSTTDDPPAPGQAHVYRVTASQGGQLVGGYTVVHLG
jgi:hypothetical protein